MAVNIRHPAQSPRYADLRSLSGIQTLAICTEIDIVAASIRPQGCGKGQNMFATAAQNTVPATGQSRNRACRSGSACRHHRKTKNKNPKYVRKAYVGAP